MTVVSNTSPLIALAKVSQLTLLQRLFSKILVPTAVAQEFLNNCTTPERDQFTQATQTFLKVLTVPALQRFQRRLGLGEQEALTLAQQTQADLLLIDDRKASNEAREHSLVIASTRAVLRIAEEKGLVADSRAVENLLKDKRIFLPDY